MSLKTFKPEISLDAIDNDYSKIIDIGKALSVENRIKIISALTDGAKTVAELSNVLALPISNVIFHLNVLEKANIVKVFPSGKGYKASLLTFNISINLKDVETKQEAERQISSEEFDVPVGAFAELHDINYGFNLKNKNGETLALENEYDPKKYDAQLVFSGSGSITYPLPKVKDGLCEICISLEICSEAPFYAIDHPSEIFFLINGVKVASYISPGDLGGRKGNLNPPSYPDNLTQFGQLKSVVINKKGVFFDGIFLSEKLKIDDLNLKTDSTNTLRIGNLPESKYTGGFNIFGKEFGDYSQGIKVIYKY
ncbi:MAG: ArsR family transcriptional regulator [Bacilli bacterium]|nr:ArsR family transcriptional regulator [Bacilli bacterium]